VLHLSTLPRHSPSPLFADQILEAVSTTSPVLARARKHWDPDELDAWLADQLPVERVWHLETCEECRLLAATERELVERLRAVPLLAPEGGFADRVMAAMPAATMPAPAFGWEPRLASRRSRVFAATVGTAVLASMVGSVVWSLNNQALLSSAGLWLGQQAQQWLWVGFRAAVSNLIEQPWYAGFRSFAASPARLALISAGASALYCSGLLAFRRLLTLPLPSDASARA
jgi:hypothetical protein